MVIKDILQESRSLYQTQYDQAVARLIHIPKGSLRIKVRKGSKYYYLRRYNASIGCRDEYIGQAGNRDVENFLTFIGERKQRVEELKAIKQSLNQLGVKNVELQEKGYHKKFTALLEAFGEAGLWNEGLMLIGSWCFNIYTQAFGEYRDAALQKGKIRKDFKQAALVAKKILTTANLKKELNTIVTQLNKDLSKILIEGAKTADQFVKAPDLTVTDVQYIEMAMKR